ncbi:MAG TPA: hypothetical protein VIW45_02495 [Vicinamibacterales bacterium]|jgi:hypothetical protein
MDEHDDDLESTVREDAEEETAGYANTGDDVEEDIMGAGDVVDEPLDLDDDDAEL